MATLPDIKALNNAETMQALFLSVQYTYSAGVNGNIAEFGTNTGRTAQYIAAAIADVDKQSAVKGKEVQNDRRLHLFDSFKGMPKATHEVDITSPLVADGSWGEGKLKTLTAEQLYSLISRIMAPDRIAVFEGFYEDTLDKIPSDAIYSMVHMDCTLYGSTREVLEYLFAKSHIAEGAVILFRGYNANRARNDSGERRAWLEVREKFNVVCSEPIYYAWQCARFFIHGYAGMQKA